MVQTRSQTTRRSTAAPAQVNKRPRRDRASLTKRKRRHSSEKEQREKREGALSVGDDKSPDFQAGESKKKELGQFLHGLVAKFGGPPLQGMVDQTWSESNVFLAHLLNALLSSARISHDIAMRTLKCLFDEQFYDLQVLRQTTWDERTQILTKGGYTRYREKTATFLGDLIELLENRYSKVDQTPSYHRDHH
jgi:hypothetical protein